MLFYALLALCSITLAALLVFVVRVLHKWSNHVVRRLRRAPVRAPRAALQVSELSALDPETLQMRYRSAPYLSKPWGW